MTPGSARHRAERERFVADLLAYMTVGEKAGQLALLPHPPDPADRRTLHEEANFFERLRHGLVGSVHGIAGLAHAEALQRIAIEETRLGIPLLFAGSPGTGVATILPVPASAAASWDVEAIERAEAVVAGQARAIGMNWVFAPEIRLSIGEARKEYASTSGQEPLLAERIALARIRGLQHGEIKDDRVLACLELGLDRADEEVVRAHRSIMVAALHEDGAGSVVFPVDGGPMDFRSSQSPGPLAQLRLPGKYHGILLAEWAEIAALAGQDRLAGGFAGLSVERVVAAVSDGRLPERRLDEAVERVLGAKFDLGLFRSALNGMPDPAKVQTRTSAHAGDAALDLARKSVVLLRNSPALLPLTADSNDLLVVGSAAADRSLPLAGRKGSAASLIDGLEELGVDFKFVPGLSLRREGSEEHRLIDADRMAIGMAGEAARRARTVVVALDGPDSATGEFELGEAHRQLLESLQTANSRIVLVTLGARPIDPILAGGPLACVLHAGLLGTMSGHAIAEVLTGEYAPTGRLPSAFEPTAGSHALPFGFGLGFGDVRLSSFSLELGADCVLAQVELINSGEKDACEIIQLYVRACEGPLLDAQPRLRDFQRLRLAPGERCVFAFELGATELGSYAPDGRLLLTPGTYEIRLGTSAAHAYGAEIALPDAVVQAMMRPGLRGSHIESRRRA